MKVLLINHFPLEGSGSGVYTLNIAKELVKQGNEVRVIVPSNTKDYPRYKNIKIHPVYFLKDEKIKGQLKFNFPCFTTHPNSVKTFYDLTEKEEELYMEKFKNAIEKEIKEFKPNVIHSGHIWLLSYLATTFNVPVVITCHGTDLIGYNTSDRYKRYLEYATSNCKHIIAISKDNKELVEKTFPNSKNKLSLITNGYVEDMFYKEDLNKKEVLKEIGINKNYEKIVMYAGKLTEIKGVDTLLKACKKYEDNKTATIICGNGELYDELLKLKDDLKLKNVYFIGNQKQEVLRKLYNIADVTVVPSRYEAFGLVAVEALACGSYTIVSNVGGLSSIIKDNVGDIFEIDNVDELSSKIIDIINGTTKYDRDYIANYAKEEYSNSKYINDLIKIYNKVK